MAKVTWAGGKDGGFVTYGGHMPCISCGIDVGSEAPHKWWCRNINRKYLNVEPMPLTKRWWRR
jgi:hypothetical protein